MAETMDERQNRSLKVLQIAPEYPPFNIGGGGRVVQDISRRLSARGELAGVLAGYYPTETILDRAPPLTDRFVSGSLDVDWLPLVPSSSLALRTYMPPNSVAFLTLVRRMLRDDYDLIHLHGYGTLVTSIAAIMARLFRRRYVLTLHGFPRSPLEGKGAVRIIYDLYSRTLGAMTMGGAHRIIAISTAVKDEAVSYGAREDRIVVIPNGIDLDVERPHDGPLDRKALGLERSDRIIVSVGACHERKGFQHLISALPLILEEHPDIILAIVGGDSGYQKELEGLAERQGVRELVVFTGFLDGAAKEALVNEAEVYVIPSLVEPFGLVALEGMSMGKAIVSSNADGLGEIFEDDETAILVPAGDPARLAEGIGRLLDDRAAAERMGRNAQKAVRRYDWNNVIEAYRALYRESAASRRKG